MKNPMDKKITHHILVTNCELGENDSLLKVLTQTGLFIIALPVGVAVFWFSVKIFIWLLQTFVITQGTLSIK